MNVEIGAEAAQFPEKEYINGIAFAVQVGLESGSGIIARDPDPPTASHFLAHYHIQPTLLSF
jgi:hypothetical protein